MWVVWCILHISKENTCRISVFPCDAISCSEKEWFLQIAFKYSFHFNDAEVNCRLGSHSLTKSAGWINDAMKPSRNGPIAHCNGCFGGFQWCPIWPLACGCYMGGFVKDYSICRNGQKLSPKQSDWYWFPRFVSGQVLFSHDYETWNIKHTHCIILIAENKTMPCKVSSTHVCILIQEYHATAFHVV